MTDEIRRGESVAKLVGIWERRKWVAILGFAAVFAISATATFVLPKIYQSVATVSIVGQQIPPDVAKPPVSGSPDARLQTLSQEILSRSRLDDLIRQFDLYPKGRTKLSADALVERVRHDIEVKPIGFDRTGMTAFTVKYHGPDAETVATVANTLASYYVDEYTKVRERQAKGVTEFVRAQLADVKTTLEQQERKISEFKRQYHDELPAEMESNRQQLERITNQLRVNRESQIRTRNQIESVKSIQTIPMVPAPPTRPGSAVPAPSSPETAQLNKLKQELDKLRQELDVLLAQYTDRHPDVIHKRREIGALERKIADLERTIAERPTMPVPLKEPVVPSPNSEAMRLEQVLAELKAELNSLMEAEAKLAAESAKYQARVNSTPRRDVELQALSRDYDSTRELYRTLLKRYQEAQLAESLERGQKSEQFRITDRAVPATSPSAPNRSRLLLMSLALSAGLAVALVLLAEQLDTSVHTIDELRAVTTFPVLGAIPRIVTEADARRRWRRVSFATVGAICGLVLLVGSTYYLTAGNEELLRILSWRF